MSRIIKDELILRTRGKSQRIKTRFQQMVDVPADLKAYLWDHPGGKAPLEKLILRVCEYGHFGQLKTIYQQYPDECYDIINRYPDIKRGVKYWINDWHGKND